MGDTNILQAEAERKEIFLSRILAQATFKEKDGDVMITFHEKSTIDCAYFVSKGKRSFTQHEWDVLWYTAPGRSWGKGRYVQKLGFWEFANDVAVKRSGNKTASVAVKNFIPPEEVFERVTALMDEWNIKRVPILDRKGVDFYANNRDRRYDNGVPHDPDRVALYKDWCPECGELHLTSHWPSGKVLCRSLQDLKSNPTIHFMYFESNTRTYYFGFNSNRR